MWWPLWALGISEHCVYNKDAKIAVFVFGEGFTDAIRNFLLWPNCTAKILISLSVCVLKRSKEV